MFVAIKEFIKKETGAMAVTIAAILIPMILIAGFAVDIAHVIYVQSRLDAAADASLVAAGRASEPIANRTAEAQRFFAQNFPISLAATRTMALAESLVTANGKRLTVTCTANVPVYFMKLIGFSTLAVKSIATVDLQFKSLELALVLDTTKSMLGAPLASLKTASKALLDSIYGTSATLSKVWVTIVPYVASVNIGVASTAANRNLWLRPNTNSFGYYPGTWNDPYTGWTGCVEARFFGAYGNANDLGELDDTPPLAGTTTTRWKPYRWPGSKKTATFGTACAQPLMPLQSDLATAKAKIDSLAAGVGGGTLSDMGLIWGWRVLSPRFRGLWHNPNPNGLPLDYANSNKILIIFTDGTNNWTSDYSAFGKYDSGALGPVNLPPSTTLPTPKSRIDTHMSQICTSIKAAGITLYAVTLNVNAATQTLFRNCATSGTGYYYNSTSAGDIESVFQSISNSISNLRYRWSGSSF